MALLCEKFKSSNVKIEVIIAGVPSLGSGVIYSTPGYIDYNYVITTKHIFQEDSKTPLNYTKISKIDIWHSQAGEFTLMAQLNESEITKRLIGFDGDLAILIVDKIKGITFSQFLVSEVMDENDRNFYAWGIFSANENELHKFNLERNDPEKKRFQIKSHLEHKFLPGLSGAGVFHAEKSVLYGIIGRYPNDEFQNSTIDCVGVSFADVNARLKAIQKIELDTKGSKTKRDISGIVVDINEANINGVYLNLEIARRKLKNDIEDDWFHDPLMYIDLLTHDYIFEQLQEFFEKDIYQASVAEKFHVPKKEFTLRKALILPFIDRILYIATVGVLGERLDKAMIPNVYSSRYNFHSQDQLVLNGVEQWRKMKHKLRDSAFSKNEDGNFKFGCVVEVDILNFYDNINKELLYKKVLRVCETANETAAAEFLLKILKRFSESDSGLPQNSDASALLASFYLNQVDLYMLYSVPEYYRFMDDVRIFCDDKHEARKILQLFESELQRCNLSVNSQKTKIVEFEKGDTSPSTSNQETIGRSNYALSFDYELNKISRLRISRNYANLNEAFHLSLSILKDRLENDDINNTDDSSRKLNYALNTIASLVKKNINLSQKKEHFDNTLTSAISCLKERPWITTQVCKILNLIPSDKITKQHWELLEEIAVNKKYNIYSYQTYQIWLVLAKHKHKSKELASYAVSQIEKNDDTKGPAISAMIIYMSAVDKNYRRIILRKFQEGFTRGSFQCRLTLIALRSFNTDIVKKEYIPSSLNSAHKYTHKFGEKDIIYIPGAVSDADDESNQIIDQLYSL